MCFFKNSELWKKPADGLLWSKRLLVEHIGPDLCVKFRASWNYGPPGETTLKHTLPIPTGPAGGHLGEMFLPLGSSIQGSRSLV